MKQGDLRKEIMDKCPDDFYDDLKYFIDSIEKDVGDFADSLSSISNITELYKVERVRDSLKDLAESLY